MLSHARQKVYWVLDQNVLKSAPEQNLQKSLPFTSQNSSDEVEAESLHYYKGWSNYKLKPEVVSISKMFLDSLRLTLITWRERRRVLTLKIKVLWYPCRASVCGTKEQPRDTGLKCRCKRHYVAYTGCICITRSWGYSSLLLTSPEPWGARDEASIAIPGGWIAFDDGGWSV